MHSAALPRLKPKRAPSTLSLNFGIWFETMRGRRFSLFCFLIPLLLLSGFLNEVHGSGVTLITHGLNGNVDGWVTGMAERIPQYPGLLGTNYTCYKVYLYPSGNTWLPAAVRTEGSLPTSPGSGEIVVKLDWSGVADGNSWNTYQVAATFAPALLSTNFVPELGGHALAELPLHLIGHSRGGSLICELSRLLGTNGVWVDHLTTLDPHPLNNDGFFLDAFLYSAHDAPAHTYANVLFHDNYWQNIDTLINGEAVAGAYVRKLTNLSGGNSSSHSDVHLWYHGTVDGRTPASDTDASITAAERTNWWFTSETRGTNAGFKYSLLGRGDRLSATRPLGGTNPAIRDGFNQFWDLGAGTFSNRTALTTNYGNWPSLIRFNRLDTNQITQGQSVALTYYYQWANPGGPSASIIFYLDDDLNPWNGNERVLSQSDAPSTGASAVGKGTISPGISVSNAPPGQYFIFARINVNGRSRYLYAPDPVTILPSVPPALSISRVGTTMVRVVVSGSVGQTIILDSSPDTTTWQPIATNTLSSSPWAVTNTVNPGPISQFYRAHVAN
jgi:hypothetical protein